MTSDSGHDLPNYQAKRRQQGLFRRHPVASRAGALIGGFFLLVPISMMLGLSKNADKISTQGLGGAAVGAPSVNESVTSAAAPAVVLDIATTTTVPVTVPVTEAPTTVATTAVTAAAAIVRATAAPAPVPAPTTAKPAATTAKPVATTVKPAPATAAKVAPTTVTPVATTAKPVATTAKPAPKPVATTAKPAPKPVATTAKPAPKPVVTTAKPAPATTAAPSKKWTTSEVEQLIRQMWPADSVDKALDVAWKESNYQARVFNGSCCYGVFQIHYGSHKGRLAARGLGLEGLYDPKVNIEIALEIFREQGWSPWTTA
jgi:hypothetical protein